MKWIKLSVLAVFALSGCAILQPQEPATQAPVTAEEGEVRPETRPEDAATPRLVPAEARTVEDFDTTTSEERAAAIESASAAGAQTDLGTTVASLGSASEPGFWLKTPLVSSPSKGRVVYPGTGKSVSVDLIPIDGPRTAGSRMSLSAMRLVEAPLAGLPEVQVFRVEG